MDSGWRRAVLYLAIAAPNITWCFRCPLALMISFFKSAGGVSAVIPFSQTTNNDRLQTYGTPRDSKVYQSYSESLVDGHVILVDFF